MYSTREFKEDFLLNIDNIQLKKAVEESQIEFTDSSQFTRIEWDTYCRTLSIFCSEKNSILISSQKKLLKEIAKKVHGVKDGFMITDLLIIKKNFNGIFSTNNNNSEVIIEEKIKFNKEKDCIGEGGFSRVYKYNCDILKTSFAYKILDPSSFNSAPYEINVARFINEAKTLLTFNHENIVKIYNVGRVIPNSYYIKMEWIDGKDLKGYISENGPIDIDTFINISKQIVSALYYSHSKNILHRDLAERNILITTEKKVKILDFGLAKDIKNGIDLTTYSTAINTDNMAPELKEDISKYSVQSDIYSIGCIMYRMLTNKTISLDYIKELENKEIPNNIIDIINKCLATNLEERYNNCMDIYDDLGKYKLDDIQTAYSNSEIKQFNLDYFRDLIYNGISEIIVNIEFKDTFDIYKKLMEEDIIKVINFNKFNTRIPIALLFQYFGYENIHYYNKYQIDVEDLIKMKNFYNKLPENDKINFIENIKIIISPKIKYDLPF